MSVDSENPYQEIVTCVARADEGVIFIQVVETRYQASVEFDTTQARAFAQRILLAVKTVEEGWVGKPHPVPRGRDA